MLQRLTSEPRFHSMEPFGVVVTAAHRGDVLESLPTEQVRELTWRHRVTVLRGFAPKTKADFEAYCRQWGELLEWPFGYVLELQAHEDPQNYLFTHGNVPFHWDGAFAATEPSFLVFQCLRAPAPEAGGQSLFSDTTRMLAAASREERATWERIEIEYRTEKVAHYGGSCRSALVKRHAHTGEEVLRFAEPLNEGSSQLNPIELAVEGVASQEAFLADFMPRLYSPDWCYSHQWRQGDFLVVDNRALLHGRHAYSKSTERHLQRVHIL